MVPAMIEILGTGMITAMTKKHGEKSQRQVQQQKGKITLVFLA